MDEQYDGVYGGITPFRFGRCLPYQDAENELSDFRGATVGSGGGTVGGGAAAAAATAVGLPPQQSLRRLRYEGEAAAAEAGAGAGGGGAGGASGGAAGGTLPAQMSAGAAGAGLEKEGQEGQQQEQEGQEEGQQEEGQAAVRLRSGFLYLRDEGVEAGAVPLPRKYQLPGLDIYGLRGQQYGGGGSGGGKEGGDAVAAGVQGTGAVVDGVRLG